MLTVDDVDAALAKLESRANAVIANLEEKKSWGGSVFGNNDTIESVQGAVRNVVAVGIPDLRRYGLKAVNDPEDIVTYLRTGQAIGEPSAIKITALDAWNRDGQYYSKTLDGLDGYGVDAAFSTVLSKTAAATAQDIKDKALPALSFGLGFGIVAVIVLGFLFLRTKVV